MKDNKEPYFIVNMNKIINIFNKWKLLLSDIQPYYAVKCNNNIKILELLNNLGCSFDCASKNEIKKILKITNDPTKIIFANPCKMSSHLIYANNNNINLLTFDCYEELLKIKKYHPNSKLILRIAVDDSHSICKFNIKFGCHIKNIDKIIKNMIELNLILYGFSFHVGSGCSSDIIYYDAIKLCYEAYQISKINNYHHNINIIDIGGGFQDNDKFINICNNINKAKNEFFKNINIKFIAEPGRLFVEKSHKLILNVIGKKKEIINDNIEFIYYLNDGIYGSFNCIIFDHKIPIIKSLKKNNKLYKSKFFGPTCDSIDLILENILFNELDIGDKVYIENFGAYTYSASSNFNGFKTKKIKYIL